MRAATPCPERPWPDRVFLFDAEAAAYLATRHLVEHGHGRVALVTFPPTWPNMRPLYEGCLRALEEAAVSSSTDLVVNVPDFTVGAGQAAVGRLIELQPPPSAAVAAGASLALGMLQEARARGIQVPDGLAIAGYTDVEIAALVEPGLTMISVPAAEAGRQAMRALHALIAGDDIPPRPRCWTSS